MIALEELNGMGEGGFVSALAGIFEHSPWVPQRAAARRPFASRLQLLDAMREAVQAAAAGEQLALIRAHPQLGAGRVALTAASSGEQRRAGLDACTPAQLARLAELNAAYLERFGFPFVLAVRGHDPASIIASCEHRLWQSAAHEQGVALREIGLIAGFRLADAVATSAGVEILAMDERLGRSGLATRELPARAALVREWMLAAGLELRFNLAGAVIGFSRGSADVTGTLLLGVQYDPAAGRLQYDGALGFIIGIAVMQQLRQRPLPTPWALAILASPDDERTPEQVDLAEAEVPPACVALGADAIALAGLRAAALDEPLGAMVRRRQAGQSNPVPAPLDAPAAERAARTLQQFLLQPPSITHD